ncbi:LptF/LptG family permease [Hymenobacter bucti]|uniref:LptF/LptG family permease n=1 Tax=Hymenobacter bucti TaxID=1844114 RepID=A0ABW4QRC7_9BACT
MKLLDKYIITKFLTAFFFTVVMLVSVICVIDYTEKNDDFIHHNLSFGHVFTHYYIYLFPYFANLLSPITIFLAVVFVTAKLAARTEIVAMLASGMSFGRLLVPYLMGATIIGLLTFGLVGWVIPKATKEIVHFESLHVKEPWRFEGRNVHMKIGPRSYVYLESYSSSTNTGYHFALETIDGTVLRRRLTADNLAWDSTKQAWKMSQQLVRSFRGSQDEVLQTIPARDTTLNLYPKDFANTYRLAETLTSPQLNDLINSKILRGADDTAQYLSVKFERYAYPFDILILTFIGVVLSARKSRGGVGGQIALGFVLAFIFIIFVMLSRNLAQVGSMPPLLAAWFPGMVFSAIGLVLYRLVPK